MSTERRKKRIYSEDFKREAVATYEASEKSLAEICRLLDISAVSVLRRWCVVYGKQNRKRDHMQPPKKHDKAASVNGADHRSNPEDAAKILALEEENRRLRQVLGTHAMKEYLAELREESWRELTNPETAKEVEKHVAKKR